LESDLNSLYSEARSSSPLRQNYINLKPKVNSTLTMTETLFSEAKPSPNLFRTTSFRIPRTKQTEKLPPPSVRKRSATLAEPSEYRDLIKPVYRINSTFNIKTETTELDSTLPSSLKNFDSHVRLLYHRPPEQVIKVLRI